MPLRQNQAKFVCPPIRLQYFDILNNFYWPMWSGKDNFKLDTSLALKNYLETL